MTLEFLLLFSFMSFHAYFTSHLLLLYSSHLLYTTTILYLLSFALFFDEAKWGDIGASYTLMKSKYKL